MPRKIRDAEIKEQARKYLRVVEWSEEDRCFVGSAPPLIGQSCHGKSEASVIRQLNKIIEEWVETLLEDGQPLPGPLSERQFSGRFVVRISPELHRKATLKAMARNESLNQFVAEAIAEA